MMTGEGLATGVSARAILLALLKLKASKQRQRLLSLKTPTLSPYR